MMDEKKMDERFMREAIRQARKAGALMEVPIGCVIVYEGKIIARGYTLEPCQMCAGAIVQARVSRVVIGSMNPKAGCAGSILNLLEMEQFNHQVEVTRGVLQEECSQMLSGFFKELREIKKRQKRVLTEEKQGSIMNSESADS